MGDWNTKWQTLCEAIRADADPDAIETARTTYVKALVDGAVGDIAYALAQIVDECREAHDFHGMHVAARCLAVLDAYAD